LQYEIVAATSMCYLLNLFLNAEWPQN